MVSGHRDRNQVLSDPNVYGAILPQWCPATGTGMSELTAYAVTIDC